MVHTTAIMPVCMIALKLVGSAKTGFTMLYVITQMSFLKNNDTKQYNDRNIEEC